MMQHNSRYSQAQREEEQNPKGWVPQVFQNLFAGTGGPPSNNGKPAPKLIPVNQKITHQELARLKREEYERKKLEKEARMMQRRDEYERKMKESEDQILADMKGSKYNMSMNKGSVRIDG